MENLLNVNQVAFIIKVHPLTVRRYIKEKKLKAVKLAGNIRVRESDLTQFSQEYVPHTQSRQSEISHLKIRSKEFGNDDPFLRLDGRGASVNFEK
jgi:excisionase family DNA binding protein